MHEDYEEDDYDSDDYDYDDGQNSIENSYKYFKFDPSIFDVIQDIFQQNNVWFVSGFPYKAFPVNGYNSLYGDDKKSSSYMGSNQYGEVVWKNKHFLENKLTKMYTNHLVAHAKHFIKQPNYYKGMFDILN